MKKLIIGTICFSVTLTSGTAFAVDDATVQAIDEKAATANAKADGNNSRIQALEEKDIIIEKLVLDNKTLKAEKIYVDEELVKVENKKADKVRLLEVEDKKADKTIVDANKADIELHKLELLKKADKIHVDANKVAIEEVDAKVLTKADKSVVDAHTVDIENLKGGLPAETVARIAADADLINLVNSIPAGPQGEIGPPGPEGPQGEPGPPGENVASGQRCNEGAYVIGFTEDGSIICDYVSVIPPSGKLVFITSTTHDGNLGGLSGADATCNSLAMAAGLPGNYRAWISDDQAYPAMTFTKLDEPYVLVDGTVVSENWADLVGYPNIIPNPINITEQGAPISDYNEVWTGTNPYGINLHMNSSIVESCNGWSTSDIGTTGVYGEVGIDWTYQNWGTCDQVKRLYCFEQ